MDVDNQEGSNAPETFIDGADKVLTQGSNAPESFIDGAETALTEHTENSKEAEITEDVSWEEIPQALRPILQGIIDQGAVCDPEAREFIRGAQGQGDATLGVNLEMFRKRLHQLAAEKKLPHHTIEQLKKHWPLGGPL